MNRSNSVRLHGKNLDNMKRSNDRFSFMSES